MKLYFSPGACSLSPHIVLRELGSKFDLERVDTKSHKTKAGDDFYAINPKGYVPVLALDDGQLLTEGQVIVQYLADQKPEANLVPRPGTLERYRAQEWLSFIGTELHKAFSPLFNPKTPDETKAIQKETIAKRFSFVAKQLEGKSFLLGDAFTVPDAYLFTILNWAPHVGIDLSAWPILGAYRARILERPAVRAAMEAEGLLKG